MTGRKNNLLKIAIVGCGSISGQYFGAALTTKGVRIVGATDLHRETALNRVKEFGLAEHIIFDTMDEMLTQAGPDIIFDCTVPAAHCQVTIKALNAGCHVLGEKPMADCMQSARKMVRAAGKAHRTYAVTENYRYNPHTRAVAKLIKNKMIGNLDMLNADYFMAPHFGGFREHIPNPLLVEMAIHTYDMARLISGEDPISVYCHEYNPKDSWYKGGNAAAISIFEMTNGVVFTYRGHWCAEGRSTGWNGQWRAVGDRGTAFYDGCNPPCGEMVIKQGSPAVATRLKPFQMKEARKQTAGHAALIQDFIDCIRQGRQPETNCRDNIKSIAMLHASIRSAQTGKRVKINLGM